MQEIMQEIIVVIKADMVTEVHFPKSLKGKVKVTIKDYGFDKEEPSEESFE